jgi:hypothetical protein
MLARMKKKHNTCRLMNNLALFSGIVLASNNIYNLDSGEHDLCEESFIFDTYVLNEHSNILCITGSTTALTDIFLC